MHILTIGGHDSSGGAGVLRDALTIAALGAVPYQVITAVTAQSHRRVWHITPMSAATVQAQLHAAYDTAPPAAIKIGMLATLPIVHTVKNWLAALPVRPPIVLDPVLASSSGGRLISAAGQLAMARYLAPLCTVVTPNLPEYQSLQHLNAPAILLKGGHSTDIMATDTLFERGQIVQQWSAPRLNNSKRGTGCALASSIAVYLAQGHTLRDACGHAKKWVWHYLTVDVPVAAC